MIKIKTCYTVACDVCDATPESDYGYGEDHFDSDADAVENAREGEWWATETTVLCDTTNPEHSARAADIAAHLIQNDTGGEAVSDFRSWCEMTGHELEAFGAFEDDAPDDRTPHSAAERN